MRRLRLAAAGAALLVAGALLAGCAVGTVASGSSVLALNADPSATGPYSQNYNPFLPTAAATDGQSLYAIYEPLMIVNGITGKITPMLATSYRWGTSGRSITLRIRQGVRWSDGQPFTASDVVYTFELEKKYPALAAFPFTRVSAPNPRTVVIDFAAPSYIYQSAVLQTDPVPEHIWARVANPATFQNPRPVGTGPYTLASFTAQTVTLKKNPRYWQPGRPHVGELSFHAFDSTSSMLAALESGTIQWASNKFAGGIKSFLDRDPAHNKAVPAVFSPNAIVPNVTVYPLNQVVVRKAMSMAIDSPVISKTAEDGLGPPVSSPTGLNPATEENLIAPQYRSAKVTTDVAGARRLLSRAGYTMGGNGVFVSPKGTPLSFQLLVPSGASELVSEAEVVTQELKAAGITLNVITQAQATVTADLDQGHFQLAVNPLGLTGAANPYALYQQYMDFPRSAPIGTSAHFDQGRFSDRTATSLFSQYAAVAPGSRAQTQALYGLEKVMVQQVPVILVFLGEGRSEYSDAQFTGWPPASASSSYAPGDFGFVPSAELIYLNLKLRR